MNETRGSIRKLGPGVHLGGSLGRAPVHRAGDSGLNSGPGKNFFSF